MKVFKEELEIWEQRAKNDIVEALPPHLDIELTNCCNLSCEQCPYHGSDAIVHQKLMDIDFEVYKKIIDEAAVKNVRSVKLSFSGEPLMYREFLEAVRYAKARGLKVSVNSNGTLLTYLYCVNLIKAGLDVLIITDYDNQIQFQAICILHIQKQVLKESVPYIVMKTNRPKMFENYVDECVPLEYDDYNNLKENWNVSEFSCGFPWQRFLVLADGSVVSCSCGMGLIDINNAYLGNVVNSTLEELWKSPKMNLLREVHKNKQSHLLKMCRLCPIRRRSIETL